MYFVAAVWPTCVRQVRNALVDQPLQSKRRSPWRDGEPLPLMVYGEKRGRIGGVQSRKITRGNHTRTDMIENIFGSDSQ